MTIKLMLLKSGEDIITDVSEMCVGTEEHKAGYEVTMFPWVPLTPDEDIPVPADWVITMVNPTEKLKEMYIEDIVNYGKDNQSNSADKQSNSNQSD